MLLLLVLLLLVVEGREARRRAGLLLVGLGRSEWRWRRMAWRRSCLC